MKIPLIEKFSKYKCLYALITFYICMVMISDLYESKIIHIFFLYSGSGIILFSTTFFIIGVIAYVYDTKIARLVIIMGILFCLIFMFASFVCEQLTAQYPVQQYKPVLDITRNIFFATASSSFIAENINASLVAFIKKHLDWLPAICLLTSILVSSFVSMVLFSAFAFGYRVGLNHLISMTFSSWIYRFITEAAITIPFSALLIRKLQKIEGIDNE